MQKALLFSIILLSLAVFLPLTAQEMPSSTMLRIRGRSVRPPFFPRSAICP